MKEDISNRNDIERLVMVFYDNVKKNESIGFFFWQVVKVDWDKHIPIMVDFWENVLFHTGSYSGNPMEVHRKVNIKHNMTQEHFNAWLHIFISTVNELYAGEQAQNIIQRASNIATIMQSKIVNPNPEIL